MADYIDLIRSIRSILLKVESGERACPFRLVILTHAQQLIEEALVEGVVVRDREGVPSGIGLTRINANIVPIVSKPFSSSSLPIVYGQDV
jgi:hypothetical protein